MIFTSLTFAIFALLVIGLYWIVANHRAQNVILLAASYFFYAWWDWRFCFLILGSSLLDFCIAIAIDQNQKSGYRKILVAVSVIANLGLLGLFKYFNFFAETLQVLCESVDWYVGPATLSIVLPVGISFYTFQTLSYTIDVSRGKLNASRNLVEYLTFVSFFPQLVAGPIERATALLPQFASPRRFDLDLASSGCRLILWGCVKKMLIADNLAAIVDPCFAEPDSYTGSALAIATWFFAFQIYCDFSAYSDIAIGTARILGIRLMRNFAYPYFSQSLSEFWRRWHISLSTWFRDYVYIPLGGNRCSAFRRRINLLLTFLISGFWHGAAWQFIAWGGIHGIGVAASRQDQQNNDVAAGSSLAWRLGSAGRMMRTMAIVCLGWVFFRATSLHDAFKILRKIGSDVFSSQLASQAIDFLRKDQRTALVILLLFIACEWAGRHEESPLDVTSKYRIVRWSVYSTLIWVTFLHWPIAGTGQFIYFDF